MPRTRKLTPEEVAERLREPLRRFVKALLAFKDSPALDRRIEEARAWLKFLRQMRAQRSERARKRLERLLDEDLAELASRCEPASEAQVESLVELLDFLSAALQAQPSQLSDKTLSRLAGLLRRKPKRERQPNPKVQQARALYLRAKKRGRCLTSDEIARRIIPSYYSKSPESAARTVRRWIQPVKEAGGSKKNTKRNNKRHK